MVIKFKEYTLTQDQIAVERFNLSRLITAIAKKDLVDGTKKGESFEKEEAIGWGYTLENALNVIISYELIKKDDITSINGYLKEYRAVKKELTKLLEA
jgi:hypothetical protein